jgi:chloramphenicol-sensitive protein RarD
LTSSGPRSQHYSVIAAIAAFVSWGLFPVYFKWIDQVGPWEIVAHRIIWALPVLGLFLLVRDGRALFSRLHISGRDLAWLAVSAVLLLLNWLLFVWAVVNERVLATSLGYFINPLVNILLGYLFLGERLTSNQKIAVGMAAFGTAYMGWYLGAAPWVSVSLAFSFGTYGLVRKRLDIGPMKGLMWETIVLFAPALAYLAWRQQQGQMDFLNQEASLDYLLLAAGLVTVLPLIWFNSAARVLRLTVMGFFMYLGPSISMLLAVFLWHEPFTQGHAVAFACIWSGLALITLDQVRTTRRRWRIV